MERRRALLGILVRAEAHGELRPGVDFEVAADMLVGGMFAHYLSGEMVDGAWVVRPVDAWPPTNGAEPGP